MPRPLAASTLALALLAAAPTSDTAHAAPASPKVRVIRLESDAVEGVFVRADGREVVLEGVEPPIALGAAREIRYAPNAAPRALPEGVTALRVVLRGGETIRGALEAASADELTIKAPDLPSMRLPFDAIRRVETERPDRGPCDEPGRERPARKGTDLAYARSGDALAGTLSEASAKGIVLEGDGPKQSLSWAELVVLHLDGEDPAPRSGLVTEIETAGGAMLVGTEASGDATGWKLRLLTGIDLFVPRETLIAVRWSGTSFARAEGLAFESEFTPYYPGDGIDKRHLDALYGARVDRTRRGCPLRIGGTTFRHGFAVHARSVIRIPLAGGFRRFLAGFGIDDEVLTDGAGGGAKGDVTARVRVDGREVWSSKGSVKGGEAARTIGPIDVTGAKTLELEVDFGGDFHILDRADWVDPILVRAP